MKTFVQTARAILVMCLVLIAATPVSALIIDIGKNKSIKSLNKTLANNYEIRRLAGNGDGTQAGEVQERNDDLDGGNNLNHRDWADLLHLQMTTLMAGQNLPNAVAALVSADEIHFLEGYGYADMETRTEVDPATHLFRTGSVAKIFTWTALMQLSEKGLLDLEEDIQNYLDPAISYPVRYRNGKDQPITFLHLMTHTAGFEDVLEDLFTFDPQPPLGEYIRRHQPARIFPPGTVMAYSNYGTALAGYIVERVAGMPFEEYLAEHVFSPLGMHRSTMVQPPPEDLAGQLVTPYRWVDDRFLSGRFEHMPSPAGGLSITAADMALFLQANLNGGFLDRDGSRGTILKEETLERMFSPLFTHHPLLGGMAHGYKEFSANGYRIIFHGGSSSVFDAGFYLIPDLDLGLFIAYSGGTYSGHRQVLRALIEHFLPVKDEELEMQLLADTLSPVPGVPAIADLTGEYFQSRTMVTGPDRLLNLIMGTLFVMPVDERRFSTVILGEDFVFEELVPGIYRNTRDTGVYPFGPLRYLVAGKAPDGRTMLMTDGPLTYIRAPWYGGSAMALVILAPMLLLAAGSLIVLLAAIAIRKIRGGGGSSSPEPGAAADVVADNADADATPPSVGYGWLTAHALVLLTTIILVILYGQPHPVHLLPESAFTGRSWMDLLLDLLPFAVALLGMAVAWAAVLSLKRRARGIFFRIHYSVYAAWSLALIWFFYYWGMLGF